MNTERRPAPDRWIDLGHARVPVWIEGDGPTVVFVHGWPLTSETWRNVVPELRAHARCVTFDLPGAGESTWTDASKLSLEGLSDAIVSVVHEVAADEPVVLVGHDSGGGLARWAAAELGDAVAGLVFGNTEIPGVHSWRFSLLLGGMQLPGAAAVTGVTLRTSLGQRLLLRDCVEDRSLVPELAQRFLQPMARDRKRLDGALAVIDGVSASDFDAVGDAHPRISAPVRLVWGTACKWFPLEGARSMCGTFGGEAKLVEVPGAGLLVHEEQPERFAAEVRVLLDQITPRRSAS